MGRRIREGYQTNDYDNTDMYMRYCHMVTVLTVRAWCSVGVRSRTLKRKKDIIAMIAEEIYAYGAALRAVTDMYIYGTKEWQRNIIDELIADVQAFMTYVYVEQMNRIQPIETTNREDVLILLKDIESIGFKEAQSKKEFFSQLTEYIQNFNGTQLHRKGCLTMRH